MGAKESVHNVCHFSQVLLIRLVLLLKLLLHLLVVVLIVSPLPSLRGPGEAGVELVLHEAQQFGVLLRSEAVSTKELNTLYLGGQQTDRQTDKIGKLIV